MTRMRRYATLVAIVGLIAIGATDAVSPAERPVRPSLSGAQTPPESASLVSGTVAGLRLDGSQQVQLNRGRFVVGRHPECDVHMDARDVGRRHAYLEVREDKVTVEDLGTANGTFVNEQAVTGRAEVPDGSHLRFATVEFTVTYFRTEGQTP